LTQSARDLDLAVLERSYRAGLARPSRVIDVVYDRIDAAADGAVWIARVLRAAARARAEDLERLPPSTRDALPLWGIPFSVKDCIDVAGLPTTAGCPSYSYVPADHAVVVRRLLEAGAILIGKTNMDQFATGLAGTRSPYGTPHNPFHKDYIPGGSSSGSAVSVSSGLVAFSLGTDTGGSGRVPAAFNNLVGLKPTCGLVSGRGVVPVCGSIDTVSIFARTVAGATRVLGVIEGFDPLHPWSRRQPSGASGPAIEAPSIGIPAARFLDFQGDTDAALLFDRAVADWRRLGAGVTEIDYGPLLELNSLLFGPPFLAERFGNFAGIIEGRPDALLPVTLEILRKGADISGADVFRGQARLKVLSRQVDALWSKIDILVVPTTGSIPTRDAVNADPIAANSRLGTYTSFVNLADLAAIAIPNGFLSNGLPQGTTLIGPAHSDSRLAQSAQWFLSSRATGRSEPEQTSTRTFEATT